MPDCGQGIHLSLALLRPAGHGAFTLLELLVAVTLIVIMLALLTPSLERATQGAKQVVCGSNEHQWATALMTYGTQQRRSYPYNGSAIAGLVPIGGHNVSWNSSAVQQFWKDYLAPDFDAAADDRPDILGCPSLKWHTLNEIDTALASLLGISNGQSGYFYLPYRNPSSIDYTPAGNNWVTRSRLGAPGLAQVPIMMDVKQSDAVGSWIFPGGPFSAHADQAGTPRGGNFLFEDSSVRWYPNDQTDLGAQMLTAWNYWYKAPVQ